MRDETPEQPAPLRSGYTTGSCATATSLAAARLLLTGIASDVAEIVLPKGQHVPMQLVFCRLLDDAHSAEACTIKDAGDDPDVTHGAVVFARVRLADEPGVRFHAGPGVGTVTRAGLTLPVGEPAINPVPRQMMTAHLTELAAEHGYAGGFEVTVGVENGEALAQKTMNPRLGIIGGLSILGTTGIVRPFSCSAYIASIHQGIDVARANGYMHIAACTGNASEDAMRAYYQLPDIALIEMGDFAGAVLKHLKRAPVDKLSMCGVFGKLASSRRGISICTATIRASTCRSSLRGRRNMPRATPRCRLPSSARTRARKRSRWRANKACRSAISSVHARATSRGKSCPHRSKSRCSRSTGRATSSEWRDDARVIARWYGRRIADRAATRAEACL